MQVNIIRTFAFARLRFLRENSVAIDTFLGLEQT